MGTVFRWERLSVTYDVTNNKTDIAKRTLDLTSLLLNRFEQGERHLM